MPMNFRPNSIHPIDDCLYAAVARREDGKLLTADRRFARKLKGRLDVAVF